MGLPSVENLAQLQAAEDERKRKLDQSTLLSDKIALARQLTEEKASEAEGPAAQLKALGAGKAAVDPDVLQNASEDAFLNEQNMRRLTRRSDALATKQAALDVPGPTARERYDTMAAGAGRFANEDPALAAEELKNNPRGRESDADTLLRQLQAGSVPRETSTRPIYAGIGAQDEPYFTNLTPGELHQEQHDTNIIRGQAGEEPIQGGPHDLKRIRVGGTSLGPSGGSKDMTPQAMLLRDITAKRDEADRAPLTPIERAQDLTVQQPAWDTIAARSNPADVAGQLTQAVADQRLRPETAQVLQRRYAAMAEHATDSDTREFQPDLWQTMLAGGRPPAPGEAKARAAAGGTAVPEAEAQKQAAVQSALQAPANAPGTLPNPAETAATPSPQRTPQIGGGAPPEPPPAGGGGGPGWLATGVGEAARFGLPIAGQALGGIAGGVLGRSPGAMLAGKAAGGALGGAGGTAIANYLEDKPVDPREELLATILGGATGPALGALGKAGTAAKGLGESAIEGIQGYRAAPSVARGFQAVEEARQLGRGVLGAGQQLAGNIAAEGVPGLAETAIGERGRQVAPDLVRLLATRKGPKPSPAELEALLKLVGR